MTVREGLRCEVRARLTGRGKSQPRRHYSKEESCDNGDENWAPQCQGLERGIHRHLADSPR